MRQLPALMLATTVAAALAFADTPRDGTLDMACDLVWEVPAETDDYLLGELLVGAARDREGNVCVVDYRNADLKVFAPDGRWLRTLGRRGDGPGESRDARAVITAPDGRLGLLQIFPARIVWLHPDGTPGGATTFNATPDGSVGFVAMLHVAQHDGTILGYTTASSLLAGRISERHWIVPVDPDGSFGPAIYHREVSQPEPDPQGRVDEGEFYDVWAARWAPDGTGGVWVAAERDRYRIERHGPDGDVLEAIERTYEPRRRDDLGRRLARERMQRKRYQADEVTLRDTAPVVRSLHLSRDGDLWVDLDLGGRGPAPGTIAWIDVHRPGTGWLAQWRLTGPYDPDTDQWRWLDDHHLLVLGTDGDGEPILRLLRLP